MKLRRFEAGARRIEGEINAEFAQSVCAIRLIQSRLQIAKQKARHFILEMVGSLPVQPLIAENYCGGGGGGVFGGGGA
jgi:hypothetical protein